MKKTRITMLLGVLLALVLLLSLASASALAAGHAPVTVIAYDVTNAAEQQGAASGVDLAINDPTAVAAYLKNEYSFCYWYKK